MSVDRRAGWGQSRVLDQLCQPVKLQGLGAVCLISIATVCTTQLTRGAQNQLTAPGFVAFLALDSLENMSDSIINCPITWKDLKMIESCSYVLPIVIQELYLESVLVVPFESIQPFGCRFFQEANHYWYLLALRYVHIAMMSLLLPLAWAFKKDDTSPFLASAKDVGVFLPLWVSWLSLLDVRHVGRCFYHVLSELSFESASAL